MRLPIELPIRIYELVLGHRKLHVAFEFGTLSIVLSKGTRFWNGAGGIPPAPGTRRKMLP